MGIPNHVKQFIKSNFTSLTLDEFNNEHEKPWEPLQNNPQDFVIYRTIVKNIKNDVRKTYYIVPKEDHEHIDGYWIHYSKYPYLGYWYAYNMNINFDVVAFGKDDIQISNQTPVSPFKI